MAVHFPLRLFYLLEDHQNNGTILSWKFVDGECDGTFTLHNEDALLAIFSNIKIQSFQRRLQEFGFRKQNPRSFPSEYRHPSGNFIPNHEDLVTPIHHNPPAVIPGAEEDAEPENHQEEDAEPENHQEEDAKLENHQEAAVEDRDPDLHRVLEQNFRLVAEIARLRELLDGILNLAIQKDDHPQP